MAPLKCIVILAILMAVSADSGFRYKPKYMKKIIDLVLEQKSNTCAVLVVDGRIKFVSTEEAAPQKMAKCGKHVNIQDLKTIRTTFKPLYPTDIIEKLNKIGETMNTFLVYFTATTSKKVISVTITKWRHWGLLSKILRSKRRKPVRVVNVTHFKPTQVDRPVDHPTIKEIIVTKTTQNPLGNWLGSLFGNKNDAKPL